MNFSIIIPTYNRCAQVLALLKQIDKQAQHYPGDIEVLVINNASTDNTKKKIREFQWKYILPLVIDESRRGPSFCRNAGIRQASYSHLIFIDDDIQIATHFFELWKKYWLKHKDATVIFGQMKAKCRKKLPSELRQKEQEMIEKFYWCYAATKLGHEEKILKLDEVFFSACFSYKQPNKKEYFDERLGVITMGLLLGAEDLELSLRLLLKGKKIVYSPEIQNTNKFGIERLSYVYIVRRHIWAAIEVLYKEKLIRDKFGPKLSDELTFSYQLWCKITHIRRPWEIIPVYREFFSSWPKISFLVSYWVNQHLFK